MKELGCDFDAAWEVAKVKDREIYQRLMGTPNPPRDRIRKRRLCRGAAYGRGEVEFNQPRLPADANDGPISCSVMERDDVQAQGALQSSHWPLNFTSLIDSPFPIYHDHRLLPARPRSRLDCQPIGGETVRTARVLGTSAVNSSRNSTRPASESVLWKAGFRNCTRPHRTRASSKSLSSYCERRDIDLAEQG